MEGQAKDDKITKFSSTHEVFVHNTNHSYCGSFAADENAAKIS